MGLLSGIGDFFSSAVDFVVDPIKSVVDPVLDVFGMDFSSTAKDLGSQYLSNQLIGQPNAAYSYAMSKEAADTAWTRSQKAANQAWERAQWATNKQYDQNIDFYKNRYQWTAEDMKSAGLNPILAASGGFNVGSVPNFGMAQPALASGPAAQAPSVSYPQAGSSALNFSKATEAQSSSEKQKQEIQESRQRVRESIARIQKIRAERGLITQQEQTSAATMFKLENEFMKVAAEIENLQSRTELNEQQNLNLRAERKKITALVNQIKAETSKLRKIAKVYDNPGGQFIAYLSEIMKAIGIPVAGALTRMGR